MGILLRKTLMLVLCACFFTGSVTAQPVLVTRAVQMRCFSYDPQTEVFAMFLDRGSVSFANMQDVSRTLLDYFLTGVSLPDECFWVNLRPDAADHVIDERLARTDLGRVLLEADLQLKKDLARLTSPLVPSGKAYWDKVYAKAAELYAGAIADIPTLSRPWIVPGEIIIAERGNAAYVYKASLAVMLEQDYLKMPGHDFTDERARSLNEYSSQLIRETIIPLLTVEVNSSERYAALRQAYHSLVLSRWFKEHFRGSAGMYTSRIDSGDLTGLVSKTAWSPRDYFNQYRASFENGEYNVQRIERSAKSPVVRVYISGGIDLTASPMSAVTGSFTAGRDFTGTALEKIFGMASRDGGRLNQPVPGGQNVVLARKRAYYVSITMGGDKVAVTLIDGNNEIVGKTVELRWSDDPRFAGARIKEKDPAVVEAVMDQIDSMILRVLRENGVGVENVIGENASLAGPVDSGAGIFGSDFPTPNLCFDRFPWRETRRKHLEHIGIVPVFIDIGNDAAKAVDGEIATQKGALHDGEGNPLPGGVLIVGGGIGGASTDGRIREPGHNIVQVRAADGTVHWRAGDNVTKGLHPVEVGAERDVILLHSGKLGEEYLRDPEAFRRKYPPEFIIEEGLHDVEDVLSGPNIRSFIAAEIARARERDGDSEHAMIDALEDAARMPENKGQLERALTPEAARGNLFAIGIIEKVGAELGRAIAAMEFHHRGEDVNSRLVLVSGINENLGKGVYRQGEAEDIYITAIRRSAVFEMVNHFGMPQEEAERIASGIVRSREDYTRELRSHHITGDELRAFASRDGGSVRERAEDGFGGIDLRQLRMSCRPAGSFSGLELSFPAESVSAPLDLDAEFKMLTAMVSAGILPSDTRLEDFVAACYHRGELVRRAPAIADCLTGIFRLQEQKAIPASGMLRRIAVIVGGI